MNTARIGIAAAIILGMSLSTGTSAALAQGADLQPAVHTSPDAATVAVQSARVAPAHAAAAANGQPRLSQELPQPQPRPQTQSQPSHARPAVKPTAAAGGVDSIELSTTEISGNRELPKLMYVVPWRRDQLGKFVGRPPNSLVDQALRPVDRAVFERQNRYYAALQAAVQSARSQRATAGAAAAAPAPKDER